jgi:serine/threonine protein phosphatase PrpC
MSFTVEVAGKTDVGCVRTNNEDNFGYDTRLGIFVVCDGMGGQAAGEVASKMGVDAVLNYFREAGKNGSYPAIGMQAENVSDRARALASAIHLANQLIHEAAAEKAARRGMGATIVTVLVKGEFFSVAHVGDSRIYLLRNGNFQQITNDHSLVMEQVRRGMMTREEAEKSENQNIILRALGPEEKVEPDLDDMMAQDGDVLLLATDGLTKLVNDEKMRDIIMAAPSLERACDELIEAAKGAGGEDNVTCVLVRIVRQPRYKQWFGGLLPGGGNEKWQNSF